MEEKMEKDTTQNPESTASQWDDLTKQADFHREQYGPGTDAEASLRKQAEATGGANEAKAQELEKQADFYRNSYGPGSSEESNLRAQARSLRENK